VYDALEEGSTPEEPPQGGRYSQTKTISVSLEQDAHHKAVGLFQWNLHSMP